MRVLMVHNHYLARGGEDESVEAEAAVLREHGHDIELLEAFNEDLLEMNGVHRAVTTIWSQRWYREVRRRLHIGRHDVVHVQNFFPLVSPAVYYAARAERVPVVQAVRNYRLVCPNALLFRDGHNCDDCLGRGVPWPGVVHRCYKDSVIASAGVASMLAVHRGLRTWQRGVDVFVATSDHIRSILVAGGLPADRIVVKPNFVWPDPGPGSGAGRYALYVGRVAVEKGVRTLLEAWSTNPDLPRLLVLGAGPMAEAVKDAATASEGRISYLGEQPLRDTYRIMRDAAVLVVPSLWHEPFGRVAVEAFACGTPVVATSIGALREIVEPGRGGFLFPPGDAVALASTVRAVMDDDTAALRDTARHAYLARFTGASNAELLLSVYEQARARVR